MPFTKVSPEVRRRISWVMLIGGLIGWPLCALTVARAEPQVVLGLSFLAVIYEGWNGVQIAEDADSDD